jgi:hypothetical protein
MTAGTGGLADHRGFFQQRRSQAEILVASICCPL